MVSDRILYEGDSELEHYLVVDTVYEGRQARVLYSGNRAAAQSGIARDGQPDLLFDYNQRFMELVESVWPSRVLLIGGGAFSLPLALLAKFPNLIIDVVELDPGLQAIAERYFGLSPNERLHITYGDGRHFLDNSTNVYDLILIDAFSNTTIPRSLTTRQAVQAIASHLTADGVAAMNVISPYHGRNAELIQTLQTAYSAAFQHIDIYPASRSIFTLWLPQNLVLVAQKGKRQAINLRYGALPPSQD